MMKAMLAFVGSMSLALPAAAISPGQLEDFQAGNAGGWTGAPRTVVGSGQLGGSDLFLRVTSTGGAGAGSRLVLHQNNVWTGDYTANGVTAISADFINLGSTNLEIRLGILGSGGAWSLTAGVVLPAGGGWQTIRLSVLPADLSPVGLATDVDLTLSSVSVLRLFHSTVPAFGNNFAAGSSPAPIAAQIGIDNIGAQPMESPVPFVNPGTNSNQQSFVRFVNKAATPTDIEIQAFDDNGFAAPGGSVSTTLAPFESLQLTAQDLEQGNASKGIVGSLGDGTGKWQLTVLANGAIEVLSLIRTPDGFLTSVNDVAPKTGTTVNEIFFANPASNQIQQSFLRFINQSNVAGFVTLSGVDDNGIPAPGTDITFTLLPKESKQLNNLDYENGNGAKGLSGALGDGTGKWHLTATSDVDLEVMSLIRTPDGFLTNLSGVVPSDASQNHQIYYANPASETGQVTFIRFVNNAPMSTATVTIDGIDDNGAAAPGGVVQFQLGPLEAKQLLVADLENGNAGKGLTGALGDGAGKWQLIVTADVDIAVMNLIRTADGFLTNLSRVAPTSAPNTTEVYLLNPGSNTNQRSLLRVVNTTGTTGTVTITGVDDNGDAAPGVVSFQIGANRGLVLTAQDIENGNASKGLSGALGDGAGKWHLTVESTIDVAILSLLDTPNGFITNLSRPSGN